MDVMWSSVLGSRHLRIMGIGTKSHWLFVSQFKAMILQQKEFRDKLFQSLFKSEKSCVSKEKPAWNIGLFLETEIP